eukprot:3644637-Pyramimonas_sp.AAC.3
MHDLDLRLYRGHSNRKSHRDDESSSFAVASQSSGIYIRSEGADFHGGPRGSGGGAQGAAGAFRLFRHNAI